MSKVKDRIFISIGVSNPRGGLEELPGVITAVERMAVWAKAQGYVPKLLTDPNDLAIFKAAESLWMELAGTGVILDFEFLRAK